MKDKLDDDYVNVWIKRNVRAEVKVLAAEEDKTISEMIQAAIRLYKWSLNTKPVIPSGTSLAYDNRTPLMPDQLSNIQTWNDQHNF